MNQQSQEAPMDLYSDVIASMSRHERAALFAAIREGHRRGLTGAALEAETHRLIGVATCEEMTRAAMAKGESR
jgi:hypothetical protein